ncbi:MAG: hypothetical protein Q9226_002225 [Calogaya cf. arnoldii]
MLLTSILATLPLLASALPAPQEKEASCQHGNNWADEGQKVLNTIDLAKIYDVPMRYPCSGKNSDETCVWVDIQISAQKDGKKEGTISGNQFFNGLMGLMEKGGDDGSACLSRDGTYEFQLGTPTSAL